jgi:hypothetical protein
MFTLAAGPDSPRSSCRLYAAHYGVVVGCRAVPAQGCIAPIPRVNSTRRQDGGRSRSGAVSSAGQRPRPGSLRSRAWWMSALAPNCETSRAYDDFDCRLPRARGGLVTVDVGGCHHRRGVVDCGSREQSEGVLIEPGRVTDHGMGDHGDHVRTTRWRCGRSSRLCRPVGSRRPWRRWQRLRRSRCAGPDIRSCLAVSLPCRRPPRRASADRRVGAVSPRG